MPSMLGVVSLRNLVLRWPPRNYRWRLRSLWLSCGVALLCGLFSLGASGCGSAASNGESLFDSSRVHEISVSFAQEDYDAMIATYRSTGEKDWIKATVTIDGSTYERVGLRLKGNSSLMTMRRGTAGRGVEGSSDASQPESLPWLIRLDKYVAGQTHDGIADLVVRSSTTTTAMNEAVSLELLKAAGLPSQKAIAVRFTVNQGKAVLRLVTENPDDIWMANNFNSFGALYKAESTGDYSYRGEDPASYENVFDQEAGETNASLAPLIDFLDFLNNSSDATFKAELPKHLDVEAFATYLAAEELLQNSDDIDGPGNNSYLFYDRSTGRFTVVPWDHNLALGSGQLGLGGAQTRLGGSAPQGQTIRSAGTLRQKSNVLVQRFLADFDFKALYERRLGELRITLYESGLADDILARWTALLKTQASDLVSSSVVDEEAARIASCIAGQ